MSSATCLNLDQSKTLSSGNGLRVRIKKRTLNNVFIYIVLALPSSAHESMCSSVALELPFQFSDSLRTSYFAVTYICAMLCEKGA